MPIRSFVKIYGPPLMEAIEALEKIDIGSLDIPVKTVGFTLGEYDYCFEWVRGQPKPSQFYKLIEKIDEALTPIDVRYTIQTFVRL
jgi:hypothetical protein